MKRLQAFIALLTLGQLLHADPFPLFSTGVDPSGQPLAGDSLDLHWTIISGPGISTPVPASVKFNQEIGFYPESPASKWIWTAAGTGITNSPYTFRTTFDLTGYDPRTAVISGNWAVDNAGVILLNGTNTGIGNGVLTLSGTFTTNFTGFHSFTLTNNFRPGTNTLDILAADFGGGSGLVVTELSGTAERALTIRVSEIEICWSSVTNSTYQIQYRSVLTTNVWTPLVECVAGNGTKNCVVDTVAEGQEKRFYRVVLANCIPPR